MSWLLGVNMQLSMTVVEAKNVSTDFKSFWPFY